MACVPPPDALPMCYIVETVETVESVTFTDFINTLINSLPNLFDSYHVLAALNYLLGGITSFIVGFLSNFFSNMYLLVTGQLPAWMFFVLVLWLIYVVLHDVFGINFGQLFRGNIDPEGTPSSQQRTRHDRLRKRYLRALQQNDRERARQVCYDAFNDRRAGNILMSKVDEERWETRRRLLNGNNRDISTEYQAALRQLNGHPNSERAQEAVEDILMLYRKWNKLLDHYVKVFKDTPKNGVRDWKRNSILTKILSVDADQDSLAKAIVKLQLNAMQWRTVMDGLYTNKLYKCIDYIIRDPKTKKDPALNNYHAGELALCQMLREPYDLDPTPDRYGRVAVWLLSHGGDINALCHWPLFQDRHASYALWIAYKHNSTTLLNYVLSNNIEQKEANYPVRGDGFHALLRACGDVKTAKRDQFLESVKKKLRIRSQDPLSECLSFPWPITPDELMRTYSNLNKCLEGILTELNTEMSQGSTMKKAAKKKRTPAKATVESESFVPEEETVEESERNKRASDTRRKYASQGYQRVEPAVPSDGEKSSTSMASSDTMTAIVEPKPKKSKKGNKSQSRRIYISPKELDAMIDAIPDKMLDTDLDLSPSDTENDDENESDNFDGDVDIGLSMEGEDEFDELAWDVECTASVWKTLCKKVGSLTKQSLIRALRNLARGDMAREMRQEYRLDDESTIYTMPIGSNVTVVWQEAIAFSKRRNDFLENSTTIYAKTIRVWDVLLNAEKEIGSSIDKIYRSIQRGRESTVQKFLRSCDANIRYSNGVKLPKTYTEVGKDEATADDTTWTPPASCKENEYHIMKFYSMTTRMVRYILHHKDINVDFPFNVTDIEYKFIHMKQVPERPLLILGRSGTGKTTCCLYRLWLHFTDYWDRVTLTGDPNITRRLDNQSETDEERRVCDHLHQVFISKNDRLCDSVGKLFRQMCLGSGSVSSSSKLPLPDSLQSVEDKHFPMFLTSRQLLVLLDESDIGGPKFFSRPREEVTYEVFNHKLWPKLKNACGGKSGEQFHASLVWMEIISFIKGSVEALRSSEGYLSLEDYIALGKKKAPHFEGNREKVYAVFKAYRSLCQNDRWKGYFDECDLLHDIYHRLLNSNHEWVVHQFFVDEVQDFTEAELCLLIHICQERNSMFFTGDTAQNIMRGVAFRFSNLKTLFHDVQSIEREEGFHDNVVNIPRKIHKLTQNYRTHAGVMRLANAVIELLTHFFPYSFDATEEDRALFEGPKPIIFESDNFKEVQPLLGGSVENSTDIEFGAHQAIIIANEDAKEKLPEGLKGSPLLFTVCESKGLEFDDVLLINFFKDSEAKEEWRVVSEYLQELIDKQATNTRADLGLVEIDLDVLSEMDRAHPLGFDPDKHKILNSELKHLYTAITRARVNVWIYDEDTDARKPVFEFFRAKKLVATYQESIDTNSNSGLVFGKKSTPRQWRHKGKEMYESKNFQQAAACFAKAGDKIMEALSLAQHTEVTAPTKPTDQESRREYAYAAEQYLQSGGRWRCVYERVAYCLYKSDDRKRAAVVYQHLGEFLEAARHYRACNMQQEATRCYKRAGRYDKSVRIWYDIRQYENALLVWKEYETELKTCDKASDRGKLLAQHSPNSVIELDNLSFYVAGNKLMKENKPEAAVEILCHLNWAHDEIADWMEMKGKTITAADMLKSKGELMEAARRYRHLDMYESAIECLLQCSETEPDRDRQLAQCYLVLCQRYHRQHDKSEEDDKQYRDNMDAARKLAEKISAHELLGRCILLDAIVSQSVEKCEEARDCFEKAKSKIGQIECINQMLEIGKGTKPKIILCGLKMYESVMAALKRQDGNDTKILQFYAFLDVVNKRENASTPDRIRQFLMRKLQRLLSFGVTVWRDFIRDNTQCRVYQSGQLCPTQPACPFRHESQTEESFHKLFVAIKKLMVVHGAVMKLYTSDEEIRVSMQNYGKVDFGCSEQLAQLLLLERNKLPNQAKLMELISPIWKGPDSGVLQDILAFNMDLESDDDGQIHVLSLNIDKLMMMTYGLLIRGELKLAQGENFTAMFDKLIERLEKVMTDDDATVFRQGELRTHSFRLFLQSFRDHYRHSDPYLAMKSCNIFIKMIVHNAHKCSTLRPHLATILPVLELQLYRGLLYYLFSAARQYRVPFAFFPESYATLSRVLDTVCLQDNITNTERIVRRYRVHNHEVFYRNLKWHISTLCELILGVRSKGFDIIRLATDCEDLFTVERAVTLSVTILVNVGFMIENDTKVRDLSLEEIILRHLNDLKDACKSMSPRLEKFLTDIQRCACLNGILREFNSFLIQCNGQLLKGVWTRAGLESSPPTAHDWTGRDVFVSYDPRYITDAYRRLEKRRDDVAAVMIDTEKEEKIELDQVKVVEVVPLDDVDREFVHENSCEICDVDMNGRIREHVASAKHKANRTNYDNYQSEIQPIKDELNRKLAELERVRQRNEPHVKIDKFYMHYRKTLEDFEKNRKRMENDKKWKERGRLVLIANKLRKIYTNVMDIAMKCSD